MNINTDNFLKGCFNFRRCANGAVETAPRYSYESGAKLYDIIVLDGSKYYRVNGSSLERTIDKITPIHCEIERHFAI